MMEQHSNSYPNSKYGIHKYIKCIITVSKDVKQNRERER